MLLCYRGTAAGSLTTDLKADSVVVKVFSDDQSANAHFLVVRLSADPDVSSWRPSGEASLTSLSSTPRLWLGSHVDADAARPVPV